MNNLIIITYFINYYFNQTIFMENEEIICRYCLSYEDKETLIYPCLCKTPVHRECLNEWLKIKYNDKQCEICLEYYENINYNDYKNKILTRLIFFILAVSGFIFLAYINNYLEEEAKPIFQLIVMIYTTVILILFLVDFLITFVPSNTNEYNTMEIR